MAQVEMRRSSKPYRSGESTEAMIIRNIQMASVWTCSVGEITTKLVNRMRLVTPHMVRATNMRIIICFMIFLSLCQPAESPRRLILRHAKSWLSTKEYSFIGYFIPVRISHLTLGWVRCLSRRRILIRALCNCDLDVPIEQPRRDA